MISWAMGAINAKDTVKAIAQGMPGDPAEPLVTAACLSAGGHGAARSRHSLRLLI
jgi:hypothetical protein